MSGFPQSSHDALSRFWEPFKSQKPLIGGKIGAAIIAQTYGDVRPDYLLKQAQRIRLTAATARPDAGDPNSIKSSNTLRQVSVGCSLAAEVAPRAQ
jgi:hypothetical protein